jgi:hypothetical protein
MNVAFTTVALHVNPQESMMKPIFRIVAFAVLTGAAGIAAAQSNSAQRFADQVGQMQALSGTGTYAFHPAPTLGQTPADPYGHPSFAQTEQALVASQQHNQYLSGPAPVLGPTAADPEGNEAFARRVAEMQALSSNSGEFGLPADGKVLADEANSTLVIAKPVATPMRSPVYTAQK